MSTVDAKADKYRAEAHLLNRERDEAVAEVERLRRQLTAAVVILNDEIAAVGYEQRAAVRSQARAFLASFPQGGEE